MEIYVELQNAYDYFNKILFNDKLDRCLITLQRQKNTFAYISYNRFVSIDDNQNFMHELALNPEYFGIKPLIEVMQSLCHEMVHLNQYQYGTPSRKTYHNSEFAEMMEQIGLMPSDTGRIGGKKTGQKMADYPIADGLFVRACNELFKDGSIIKWYDRFVPTHATVDRIYSDLHFAESLLSQNGVPSLLEVPIIKNKAISKMQKPISGAGEVSLNIITDNIDDNSIELTLQQTSKPKNANKIKYSCACDCNVWGKGGLDITCNLCGSQFIEST